MDRFNFATKYSFRDFKTAVKSFVTDQTVRYTWWLLQKQLECLPAVCGGCTFFELFIWLPYRYSMLHLGWSFGVCSHRIVLYTNKMATAEEDVFYSATASANESTDTEGDGQEPRKRLRPLSCLEPGVSKCFLSPWVALSASNNKWDDTW